MRQVQIDEFGPPEVLHLVEVPDRQPGPGQVLVRAAVAGITFVETQVRAGRPPWPGGGPKLPVVLGNGVAGAILSGVDIVSLAGTFIYGTATRRAERIEKQGACSDKTE